MGLALWQTILDQFRDGNREDVFFGVQLPHKRKVPSDIEWHVHMSLLDDPSAHTGETVILEFERVNADVGGNFAANTTLTQKTYTITGSEGERPHIVVEFLAPTEVSLDVSAIGICRLSRRGDLDTYTDNVMLLSLDAHIVIDSLGSDEEWTKHYAFAAGLALAALPGVSHALRPLALWLLS